MMFARFFFQFLIENGVKLGGKNLAKNKFFARLREKSRVGVQSKFRSFPVV
jgi:hypothetical protein